MPIQHYNYSMENLRKQYGLQIIDDCHLVRKCKAFKRNIQLINVNSFDKPKKINKLLSRSQWAI